MPGRPRKAEPEPARRTRGTGSVRFHKPSALWRATLPKKLDQQQHPEYFATRTEAAAWLDGELVRIHRAAEGPSGDTPLGVYLASYLETTSASADWSPSTVDSVVAHFRYLSALNARPLRTITRADLQLIVARLVSEGGFGRTRRDGTVRRWKLKGSYVHLLVGYWRRAFEAAVEDGLIDRNPCKRLILPPNDASQRPSWTPAEARTLASSLVGHLYEAVITLILGLGLRAGEALGLQWDDVDLEARRVRIWRNDQGRHGVLDHTKGRTDDWLPMIPPVEAALRRQLERQTWVAVYVSEWRPGKRASRDVIEKHVKRLAEEVGIRPLSPHAGRHAVGNVLGAAGIPLATISARLRHKSRKTTADWYLATEDVGEQAASDLLTDLFSGPEKTANG